MKPGTLNRNLYFWLPALTNAAPSSNSTPCEEERFLPVAERLHAHPSGILGLRLCPKTMHLGLEDGPSASHGTETGKCDLRRVLSAGEDGSMRCWTVDCDAKTITMQVGGDHQTGGHALDLTM